MAQVSEPEAKRVFAPRSLALSPDGSLLAFSWRGDLYAVSAEGGLARQLTSHVEMEDSPVFSPDGRWIAFSSNRFGGSDIFVIPSEGGESRRITWHPGGETPGSWTPDSRRILFRAQREGQENAIFSIDVRSLDLQMLMRDIRPVGSPVLSPDGKTLVYTRFGFPWSRPRYHGSRAQQLVSLDLTTGKRTELRNNERQHLWPSWTPGGDIATVTFEEITPSSSRKGQRIPKITDSPERNPNAYLIDNRGRAKRITSTVGGPVRFLTSASRADRMAFELEGEVLVMTSTTAPRPIRITATADDRVNNEEQQVLTTGASQAALSPDNKTFVFTAANDLWSVPVQQTGNRPNRSDAEQLTTWAGLDQNPLFTPDGKAVFFLSDREGAMRVYRMTLADKKTTAITSLEHDALDLELTPDRKHVSFWIAGEKGGLFKASVDGGAPVQVFSLPRPYRYENDTSYSWSPDGRWVAYTQRQPLTSVNVFLHDTQTGVSTNITRLAATHASPVFSPDGKYLYFAASRQDTGIFVAPLTREAARTEDADLKYEKPKETPKVEIELDDITSRIRMFSPGFAAGLRVDPENGSLYFLRDGALTAIGYDGQNARVLAPGVGFSGFELSLDGAKLIFVRDGLPQILELRQNGNPTRAIPFRAEWTRDLRAERSAAFAQFWREYNRTFYDPNFHGRDWTAIRARYEPFLDSVGHRSEFATVLNMMVGELEASHAEVSPAGGGVSPASVAHLGVTFDYAHRGPGIRIAEVPRRTPGSFSQTRLGEGEYIMAVNGKDVSLNESLWRDVLTGQAGRDVTLTISKTPSKTDTREVRIRAISSGEWNGILYRNRIEDRRRYVEQKSGGLLTYLDIPGMGGEQLRNFNFEAWELVAGKKGVIIDVRQNGGGNISDNLIDLIERRPHAWMQLRDAPAEPSPDRAWVDLETVVLISEGSFSDAEFYPSGMRARGFATIIGMPTPGYVISTYGLGLLDGTGARMPAWAIFNLDGTNMENNGLQPDIRIDLTLEDYLAGRDPQLDRAIEELLKKIRK